MNDVAQELGTLVAAGRTIEAIKLLREATGLGLAEARDVVEAVAAGRPLPAGLAQQLAGRPVPGAATGGELPDDVRRAAAAGNRIEAIKLLREATGLGLKEAKDLLDKALPAPAGGKRGCLLPLLCGLLAGAGGFWLA